MKSVNKVRVLMVVALALIVGALTVASTQANAAGAMRQQAQIVWHPQSGSGPVAGAQMELVRNESGVSYNIQTHSLNPGHVYTVWFAVVNKPELCAVPYGCTPMDILTNAAVVDGDVVYAGGNIAGGSDLGGFGGHIAAGPLANSWFGNGFSNPMGGHIHLVLNDHGPKIPGMVSNMLHTYRGGCTDASLPGIFPATAFADGIPGPNTCRLYQLAVFAP